MTTSFKRWYDNYPPLSKQFELLRVMKQTERNRIMIALRDFINEHNPGLIDETVMDYELGIKRRWYDEDPLCWMTINALQRCDAAQIRDASRLLKQQLALLEQSQGQ
jgi:hypothetical protein